MSEQPEETVVTAEPPQAPEQAAENWPQAPATHGKIYSFRDPVWGNDMIGMTMDTFLSIREDLKATKDALVSAQYDNIRMYQELEKRPPAPSEEPRIITPATGMRPG